MSQPPSKTASEHLAALRRAGISDAAVDAVMQADAAMQNWRRKMSRRELGHQALRELGSELDLAQFDVLVAIAAPASEFGPTAGVETMVATVAERLGIDPSRASRLVSEMVEKGYAIRQVSQADARRTIIALTDSGRQLVEAVRTYKYLILGEFFNDWTPEEREAFLPLFRRFSTWTDQTGSRRPRLEKELALLKQSLSIAEKETV